MSVPVSDRSKTNWDEKTPLEKKLISNLSGKNYKIDKIEELCSFQVEMIVRLCVRLGDFAELYDLIGRHDELENSFYYHGTGKWLGYSGSVIKKKLPSKEEMEKGRRPYKAHYTINGKWLGTVKQLGSEPVDYEGYFEVGYDDFVGEEKKFTIKDNITAEDIHLFASKRVVSHIFNKIT